MKKQHIVFLSAAAFVLGLGVSSIIDQGHLAHAEEGGLFSSGSSDVSGTAGVRGGDVMGRAILSARPNTAAVDRMEQRRVPEAQVTVFQKQGKLGRFAQ